MIGLLPAPAMPLTVTVTITRDCLAVRDRAARSVNTVMTAACWLIGQYIVEFEQAGEGRAGYGAALIKRLATDLTQRYGCGFGTVHLSQMKRFYLT